MTRHGFAAATCIGIVGAALLAVNANAMTDEECRQLPGTQFLAAIERGTCGIDIETAAGPDQASHDGRGDSDGNDGNDGDGNRGGGNKTRGGNNRPGAAPN